MTLAAVSPKPHKCRSCRQPYERLTSFQTRCTKCLAELGRKTLERQLRSEKMEMKVGLRTRTDWMKRAQAAFNAWVRLRDRQLPCVSCGTTQAVQWHAGHYRTVKAAPELRFEPLNACRQCSQCNDYLSGNLIEYRIELRKRIGDEKLDWLEGPHAPKKYTIEEIREIERRYKALAKELEKEIA